MKKIVVIFILITFGIFTWSIFHEEVVDSCPFCDQEVLAKQTIYEDNLVIAMVDYRPFLPGHMLIIPKRHVERFEELTDEEAAHMMRVIKTIDRATKKVYGTSSYFLWQKNGREVGQSVPHVHFHYIPRKNGQLSMLPMIARLCLHSLCTPLPEKELKWQVSVMREQLQMDGGHYAQENHRRVHVRGLESKKPFRNQGSIFRQSTYP